MSINAMVVAVSIAAGPSLAGAIFISRFLELVVRYQRTFRDLRDYNGLFSLPQNPCKDGPKRKFDKIGGISNALTFGLLIYSLEGIAHHENWRMIALQVLLLLVIGTLFIRRQLRQEVPILPLDLMRDSDIRLVRIILDHFIYGTVVGDGIITLLFAKCGRMK